MNRQDALKKMLGFRDAISSGNVMLDPTSKKYYLDLFENIEQSVLGDESKFPFESRLCIEQCGGLCCVGSGMDVRVNPYDIWIIMHSDWAKQLKIKSTIQLFADKPTPQFRGPLFHFYKGATSDALHCQINFKNNPQFTMCPFLAPAVYIKTEKDFRALLNGRVLDLIKTVAGGDYPSMHCALGYSKPTVCRLSPIARVLSSDGDSIYFRKDPIQDCACTNKTTKTITLKEFKQLWNIDKSGYYSQLAYLLLSPFDSTDKRVYDLDLNFKVGILFYNYDISKMHFNSFEMLLVFVYQFIEKTEQMLQIKSQLSDKNRKLFQELAKKT